MKLARALTNLFVCVLILALLVLWLVPAACVWLEERVCSPALGWCFATVGRSRSLWGVALVLPCAALLLLAALAWLIGRLRDPLRDAMDKLNHS